MFDAKSLLEALMQGAQGGQQQRGAPQPQPAGGGLGDLLGELSKTLGAPANAAAPNGGGLGGLGDILGKIMQPSGGQSAQPGGNAGGQGGGLGDILGQLQKQLGGQGGAAGGGLMDILGQVLGQATSGVKEGAGKIDQATGAGAAARDAIAKATGKSPDELLAQLQELIRNNQLGAGAALGGLGALVLGTRTGRSVAASAAKLGALALIGGLAYKAYQNYAEGKPVLGGTHAGGQPLLAAPEGSGFEPQAISNDTAVLYLRAMIAAAAADGRIDAREQQQIMGGLAQAGIDDEAQSFLQSELDSPAIIDDLAAACSSAEEALQVYTAARLAIEPNAPAETQFLAALAGRLGIDRQLVAHVDAAAAGAA